MNAAPVSGRFTSVTSKRFVRIAPIEVLGVGACYRVACSCGMVAEVPRTWWEFRVVTYGLSGFNAVDACHEALNDWQDVECLIGEN